MKYILLLLILSTGPLLAQSGSFWNSYPSQSQSRQGGSNQSADGCEWREREITITILGNDELWLNADVLSHTCDSEGKSSNYGDYVRIENRGKSPFYYRSSPPGTYENPNTKSFQRGTSSNAYYFELAPNEVRIVDVVDYRNQKEKFLPTHAVLNVKYCKPTNYPTQAGISALQRFKANQQQYNVNISNRSLQKDCGNYYYFAVVIGSYHGEDTNGHTARIECVSSNIFKTSNFSTDTDVPLPDSPRGNDFLKQNVITAVNYRKIIDGCKIYYESNTYGASSLIVFRFDSKESAKAAREEYTNFEKYMSRPSRNYIRREFASLKHDNSIFSFNQDAVCVEDE